MRHDGRLYDQTGRAQQSESVEVERVSHETTVSDEIDSPPADREAGRDERNDGGKKPVAWKDLPRKDQLIIITLARLSEPLVQTSLQVSEFLC